ncbi:MAG TPA: phosphate-starvation-inducible PsiE family protein [Candidatus Baltobacteraceae bacterium]|nr:phosphate-starvation-inducible PsiE family protein [Candidatus Baltobacteraceae bacterium]
MTHTDVHYLLSRVFELGQDAIVASLSAILLVVMAYAIRTLALIAFVQQGSPSQVLSQVVLLLVLVELFRTLIFYLREHRVSVPLMLEVAVVSELREILLNPPTSLGTQVFGNALLLAVLGALLLLFRYLAYKQKIGSSSSDGSGAY